MPRADQLPLDLRELPDQQARSVGDTQARRKADLAVLVEDIRSVGGIQPRVQPTPKEKSESGTSRSRIGWLRLDERLLGIAFALTLLVGICAYLMNWQFNILSGAKSPGRIVGKPSKWSVKLPRNRLRGHVLQ
jgi:hypothetical protein